MNPPAAQPTVFKRRSFEILALAYLLLPSVIFLLTWVRPGIGLPVAGLVLVAFVLFWRRENGITSRPKLSVGNWFFVLTLALVWILLAGVGGFLPQSSDYEKHNLLFHDLIHQTWPVKYDSASGENYLCYGLGYYLPPALGARILGETTLPFLTFLWTFAGVVLFFYWLATFGRSPKKTLLIVLLFATTETLWHLFAHILKNPQLAGIGPKITGQLAQTGLQPDYTDNFVSFQFRPQHALAAWLGTALFYEMFWVRRDPRGTGLVWTACCFWSPLMSLGLLIVPLTALKKCRWQKAFEPVNFLAAVLLFVLVIYFKGHAPLTVNGPIWKFSEGAEWLWLYPLFLALQLTPVLFLYLADLKYNLLGGLRPLFLTSAVLLLLLPFYKIGYYSDLRLQVSSTAWLLIALAASRCFQSDAFSWKRPLFVLLVVTQVLGAAYPFAKSWLPALRGHPDDFSFAATQKKYGYQNLSELKRDGYDYAAQYISRTNTVAARWLLR